MTGEDGADGPEAFYIPIEGRPAHVQKVDVLLSKKTFADA